MTRLAARHDRSLLLAARSGSACTRAGGHPGRDALHHGRRRDSPWSRGHHRRKDLRRRSGGQDTDSRRDAGPQGQDRHPRPDRRAQHPGSVGSAQQRTTIRTSWNIRRRSNRHCAVDAYNAQDRLIPWARSFGITSVHTGHAPGELISGQTMIVKTVGDTVDEALVVPRSRHRLFARIRGSQVGQPIPWHARQDDVDAAGRTDQGSGVSGQAHGSYREEGRGRRVAAAQSQPGSVEPGAAGRTRPHDHRRSRDGYRQCIRLAHEFNIRIWLDSAAESYLLIDEIKAAGVPVLIHPTMARATEDRENLSCRDGRQTAGRRHPRGHAERP